MSMKRAFFSKIGVDHCDATLAKAVCAPKLSSFCPLFLPVVTAPELNATYTDATMSSVLTSYASGFNLIAHERCLTRPQEPE